MNGWPFCNLQIFLIINDAIGTCIEEKLAIASFEAPPHEHDLRSGGGTGLSTPLVISTNSDRS
jgi:hypothetical protein